MQQANCWDNINDLLDESYTLLNNIKKLYNLSRRYAKDKSACEVCISKLKMNLYLLRLDCKSSLDYIETFNNSKRREKTDIYVFNLAIDTISRKIDNYDGLLFDNNYNN